MKIDLTGRCALITGGSKGLGLASALEMAASGANVAILARDSKTLGEARDKIAARAPQAKVLAVQCDVESADQLTAAHANVVRSLGQVDVLVNNAGRHAAGAFADISDAAWEADIALKLMATVRLTRLVWPGMLARRWGRVINVLNTYAKAPIAGSAPTSVTRAAQLALTKVLAHEGGPHNILVNALLVGRIKSDQIVRRHRESGSTLSLEAFMTQHAVDVKVPLGRMGEAEEFAGLVCFLASDAGGYINGTSINVDGGMSPVV
jgi:NAD(P)-dependent dehydrogenase (short-subunit alcohol dehydrogenase family)